MIKFNDGTFKSEIVGTLNCNFKGVKGMLTQ